MVSTPTLEQRRVQALAKVVQTSILDNPYIPHAPYPKQVAFLMAPEREVFYGGAVGGGKSDALLMGALQYAQVPGYASLLLRRTYSDLSMPGSLMSRAREWLLDTDAHWSEMDKTWTFPSGATLTFGYMKHADDRFRYRSAEFHYIGWDEGTDFTEVQYTYLLSRLRRLLGFPVPMRSRMGSNPDGPGAEWVQQRFVPLNEDTGEPEPWRNPPGRRFVPAGLDDNPYLDTEEYEYALAELDVVTRKQLREGRWDVRALGGMYDRTMTEVVEAAPEAGVQRFRFWDLAGTKPTKSNPDPDWTRGLLLAYSPATGMGWVEDVVSIRAEPAGVQQLVLSTAAADGYGVRIGMWKDPGQAGKDQAHAYAKLLSGYAFEPQPITGDKVVQARPWMAAAGNDLIRLVRGPHVRPFWAEAEAFPNKSVHDDIVDAMSGAWRMATGGRTPRLSRL